jgi:SAM-dependent methyltransferase
MNTQSSGGSAQRWGTLFGARAGDWAETWEGPQGYGTPVYQHVLDRLNVGPDIQLLDCGCGAGRFASLAADRGARISGIDASRELIEIAGQRTPEGDFRVGDIEALPWPDDAFDAATGFNCFQFADDKARALAEAGRVSSGTVAVVVPSRVEDSGIPVVFKSLFPLFPSEAIESMKQSGMFALSAPGTLENALDAAGLNIDGNDEVETPIRFKNIDTALRAFLGAGPMAIAIQHSGESKVTEAAQAALEPFAAKDEEIMLPAWYRAVLVRR